MYGSKTLNDLYLLFKSVSDFNAYEKNETTPALRFKAKDHINYSNSRKLIGDGGIRSFGNLTIITNAKTQLFNNGDIVVNIKTGEKWVIDSIVVDDNNVQKQYGLRVDQWTILNLKN